MTDPDTWSPPDGLDTGSSPHIGANIRMFREAAGLLQTDLAARIGVNQSNVARMERSASCDTDRLFQVARALGVNVAELLHSF